MILKLSFLVFYKLLRDTNNVSTFHHVAAVFISKSFIYFSTHPLVPAESSLTQKLYILCSLMLNLIYSKKFLQGGLVLFILRNCPRLVYVAELFSFML